MRSDHPDAHLIETQVSTEVVFEGRLLHVRRDTVLLPDGTHASREYIRHPGAVLVVPVLPDGRLVIERQYRYPHRRVFVEFPAGKLDPGESALATGQRELREEAGYSADEWIDFGVIHPLLSYSDEAIFVYVARGLAQVGAQLDAGEFLEVGTMSIDEMLSGIDRGEITDAKTVTALFRYARWVGHPS